MQSYALHAYPGSNMQTAAFPSMCGRRVDIAASRPHPEQGQVRKGGKPWEQSVSRQGEHPRRGRRINDYLEELAWLC